MGSTRKDYRGRPETPRSSEMLPPFKALRWPVYLLWWSYVFLLALSPLPALAQEALEIDRDGFLSNGCRWDDLTLELNCSSRGLTRVPYIHPNISSIMRQLNLVNNSLETLTIDDIKNFTEVTLLDLRSNNISVIDDEVFSARYLPKLQQLFLSKNQLTVLPPNVFKLTVFTTLDLSYNNFTYPPPALSNTNQIATLLLNNNPFQGLKKDSLANISFLVTLQGLHLHSALKVHVYTEEEQAKAKANARQEQNVLSCSSQDLNPCAPLAAFGSTFTSNRCTKLHYVYHELSACNLTMDNIDPEAFSDFTSLRALYLDLNHFPEVQRKMFARIPSLQDLYLQGCGIEHIENRAFKDLKFLNGLYLTQNNIIELYPNTFRDLIMKILDLSDCGIRNIRKGALRTRITNRLYLSRNNITVVHDQDFKELQAVRFIDLSHSNISEIRGSPFRQLDYLEELHLEHNHLEDEDVEIGTFNTSGKLIYLDLTGNKLTSIPDLSGKYFPHLHQLDIGENIISYIGKEQLRNMTSLYVLVLRSNPIEFIHNEAFMECKRVSDLNLDFTRIKRLPDMRNMVQLTDLHIVHSNLEYFPEDFCITNPQLIIIEATANNLKKLTNFSGCHDLFSLALDHNHIPEIPKGVFTGLTKLDILKLHENRISYIAPDVFNDLRILKSLTLYHNDIPDLPPRIFSQLTALRKLNLGFNRIPILPSGMFANNTLLSELWLNDNNIREVHPTAFAQMPYLELLNMSSNYFCSLEFPEGGFPSLRVLGLEQLWCLYNVPNPHTMPSAQEIFYTYAYHCCLWEDTLNSDIYKNDTVPPTTVSPDATAEVTLPPHVVPALPVNPFEKGCSSEGASPDHIAVILEFAKLYNATVRWGPNCRFTIEHPKSIGLSAEDIVNLQNGQPTTVLDNNIVVGTDTEGFFDGVNEFRNHYVHEPLSYIPWKEIKCYPQPNPLTPCDNLLDPWPIRVTIWAVWVLTLLGNIAVLFIMIAARQKMDVSQFFICVLAFSNTLLGIYLAFIAMVDIRTLGDRSFYQSALEWQKGSGCQTAGFLAIFSSQLSVYILVILTIERLYHVVTTVTAPYPKESKRLSLAGVLITVGIIYASILAVLPLNGMGVNAYDEVAICLPFVSKMPEDRNYILAILSLNMLGILIVVIAFVIVFGYVFRPSLSRQKRWEIFTSTTKLSLLMVTTFLCWFPIGVVGYSSLLQEPMINAEEAKYFIVFVFPVNALFSPIIYALITRSFRKNIWWIVTCCRNTKKSDTPQQTFRLIQRQTTSTPTSLMSSDMPRGQSPRSLTGEELRVLRQNRRSNSYSVQFNPNFSNQQQCPTPPTPGSITRMGRRASLPAVFGSNITERNSHVNDNTAQPIAFPFRLAPGLLSQLNSSLPNLPEENETEEAEILPEAQVNVVLSPCELSAFRKLSTVPEGDEADTIGDGLTFRDSVRMFGVSNNSVCYNQEDGFRNDVSSTSNLSIEYVDAQDFSGDTPTMTCIQHPSASTERSPSVPSASPAPFSISEPLKLPVKTIRVVTQPKVILIPSTYGVSPQESDTVVSTDMCTCSPDDSNCHTCINQGGTCSPTSFDYARLHEQLSPSYSVSSRRLEIVNPRFTAPSPSQGSETDV